MTDVAAHRFLISAPPLAEQRLLGVVHDGLWFHLSTPADLADAEAVLQSHAVGWSR